MYLILEIFVKQSLFQKLKIYSYFNLIKQLNQFKSLYKKSPSSNLINTWESSM